MTLTIGLETLQKNPDLGKSWGRIGLLCNQASVNRELEESVFALRQLFGAQLTALLSPQHGYFGCEQDNMIETPDAVHP